MYLGHPQILGTILPVLLEIHVTEYPNRRRILDRL